MRSDASATDSTSQDSPMSFNKSTTPKSRASQGNKPGSPSRGSQRASANPSQKSPRASQRSSSPRVKTLKPYDDTPPQLGIPTPPKDRIGTPS